MSPRPFLPFLLTLLLVIPSRAQKFSTRNDPASLEKDLEVQATQLKAVEPREMPALAEAHVKTHLRLADALADEKRYALAVATLRRAKAAANQHMIPKRAREVVPALDDQIAFIEWREKSDGRGLRCELFEGTNFASLKKIRIEPKLSFVWHTSAPDVGVPKDNFSARWTGFLLAPVPGRYKLIVHADDDAKLWMDDRMLIDVVRGRAEAFVDLTAKPHALRVEYVENAGAASLTVQWLLPGADHEVVIPPECYFADAEAASRLEGKQVTLPKGRGLRTDLFAGRDFKKPAFTRTDADIMNFFEFASPDLRLPKAFSIRYSGFLKARKPGLYKLSATIDDGVRIWIDNQLVLERWPSFPNDHDITLPLTGKPQQIVVEFHQFAGPGWIALHWQNLDDPDSPRVPIPPEAFFTDRAVAERSSVLGER